MAGVSKKYRKIRKKVARRRKMPQSDVLGGLVRQRLGVDMSSLKGRKIAGTRVERRLNETAE
jgi:hypothetical protein